MMVVYYKDKNGNITHHQIASKDTDFIKLKKDAKDFNSEQTSRTAHVIKVPDGSFCSYLLKRIEVNNRYTQDSIEQAKESIQEALDAVESLTAANCMECSENGREQNRGDINRLLDAAVEDLEEIMFYGGDNIYTCSYCTTDNCYERGGYNLCNPKWRGIRKNP